VLKSPNLKRRRPKRKTTNMVFDMQPEYGVPWQNFIKKPTKLERFLCWTIGHKWNITTIDEDTEHHSCKRCHNRHLIVSFGPFEIGYKPASTL